MDAKLKELLLQMLETEMGGVQVYGTALECVINDDLREEWEKYREQTTRHEELMREVFAELSLDPEETSPGRDAVHTLGTTFVETMKKTKAKAKPEAAELVACECVVFAETKDHANWELLSKWVEKNGKKPEAKVLKKACDEVEDQEDEHLYHSKGWCRELWISSLGMPSVLPPPEEEKDVKTAIGAARAEQSRQEMLR